MAPIPRNWMDNGVFMALKRSCKQAKRTSVLRKTGI